MTPRTWDRSHNIRFVLSDALDHPFYWWPKTLITYPIEFQDPVDLNRLVLTRIDTGESVPLQFSEVARDQKGIQTAKLNFFSDLPSGAHREFSLSLGSPIGISHKSANTARAILSFSIQVPSVFAFPELSLSRETRPALSCNFRVEANGLARQPSSSMTIR